MKELRFDDQVAIITGAGKGIGKAQALEFAARGAQVVVNNRHKTSAGAVSSADQTVSEIVGRGGKAVAEYSDICGQGAALKIIDTTIQNFGRVDVLILNAAITTAEMFHKTSLESFRSIMEVNVFANVSLLRAVLPRFREQGYGRIIFTISSAGLYGVPGASAYSASKGAMHALMLSLASENEGRNIHCNAIAPFAASQMTDAYLDEATKLSLAPESTLPAAVWLAHKDCPASGETWVTAGNRVRRAHAVESLESHLALTAEQLAQNFVAASDMTNTQSFATANHSFNSILDSIKA